VGETFTQDDIDAGDVIHYMHDGGTVPETDGFDFTVVDEDGGTLPMHAFPIQIGLSADTPFVADVCRNASDNIEITYDGHGSLLKLESSTSPYDYNERNMTWATEATGLGEGVWEDTSTPSLGSKYYRISAASSSGLIAFENFDYAEASLLDGLNGGEGWSGGWSDASSAGSIRTPGLDYSYLPVDGNTLNTAHSGSSEVRFLRDLDATIGANGTTIWVSYLIRARTNSAGSKWLAFNSGSVLMGRMWGSTFRIGQDGGNWGDTGIPMLVNHTYFLVGRLDFKSGSEDVYMWVDPDLSSEPDVSTAHASTTVSDFTCSQIRIRFEGYGDNDVDFDELRIGSTWDSVTGIAPPEPETVGMMVVDVLNGRNLVSSPFEPYPEGGGILGQSTLDKVVGGQLTGHSAVRSLSDTIETWDAINQRYVRAWYNTSSGWRDWDVPTNPPQFGHDGDAGYWFNRVLDHPDTTVKLFGKVSAADRAVPVATKRNLVGSCFPVSRSLAESGLVESGFTGHAAVRSLSDTVEFWNSTSSSYERFWYKTGIGWQPWDVGDPMRDIEPGDAIWVNLPLRTVGFTWTYPVP
jgi:hypothetical protein